MIRRRELLDALLAARDMPDGDDKIVELERIIAHADAVDELRISFGARFELIDTYHNHTERWRMLPVFTWCLTAADRHPSLLGAGETQSLRRYHKWAVAALCGTPRIGLTQTRATVDDLARRLHGGGHSPQAVYSLRARIADHLGDETMARDWLARWRTAPRDEHSDCAGCDPARQAALLAGWGEWGEAARIVEPVLNGESGCVHQPEEALAVVMVPYLHLGRFDEAARAHVHAYRRHRYERHSFPLLAQHLRFCALTGHLDRGLDIVAEHLGRLDRPFDEASAMEFAAAGALVCRLATGGGQTTDSRLATGGPGAGPAARVIHRPGHGDRPAADLTLAALGTELRIFAEDLAGRFDARNGTNHQSGRMAAWLAAHPLCAPFPLPPEESSAEEAGPEQATVDAADQTSTTVGTIIGRRR